MDIWGRTIQMNGNPEKTKSEILDLLERRPEGLSINDISHETGYHRHTVRRYVLILETAGKVFRRSMGSATLHYLKNVFDGGNVE